MKPIRPRPLAAGGLFLLVLLAGAVDLSAQALRLPFQDASRDSTGAQAITPVPGPAVPQKLDIDEAQLRRIGAKAGPEPRVVSIENEIARELGGIDAVLDNFDSLAVELLLPWRLFDLRQNLVREQRRLSGWTGVVGRRIEDLEGELQELWTIRQTWSLTEDSLSVDPAAARGLVTAAGALVASADSVIRELSVRFDHLIAVRASLEATQGRVDDALQRLESADGTARRRLLSRDAAPVWDVRAVLSGATVLGDPVAFLQRDLRAFAESVQLDRDRVALHLLLFLALLALFLTLRSRSRYWPDSDAVLQRARDLFERPISSATLLGLLATAWVYPQASLVVFETALVLTLIPIARLAPRVVPDRLRRRLFGLLGLFLLLRLAAVLPPEALAVRLTQLTAAVLATVVLLELLAGGGLDEKTHGRGFWGRLDEAALRAGVGIGALSGLLNVAGWATLAGVLIDGLVGSAYTALLVFMAALLLNGVVAGFVSGPYSRKSVTLTRYGTRIRRAFQTGIGIAALVAWIEATLQWFGLATAVNGALRSLLTASLSVGAIDLTLGRVLTFGLLVWATIWAGRMVRAVLRYDVLGRMPLSPGEADAYATLAQWATLLVGLLFAFASAGLGGGQLAVIAGALSVGIGFGLQNIVNNFVSGFILIFEQPIKTGDKIEISSLSLLGEVRRIGIRSSTIRTVEGAEVVVPNSNMIQSEVINWTLSDPSRRLGIDVGVAYGTDPATVLRLLVDVAKGNPEVLEHPEPAALFTGFGDSSLNFRLLAWSPTFDDAFRLRSDLTVQVENAIRAAGIEIPFPQRDLHLRSVDEGAARSLGRAAQGPLPDSSGARPRGAGGSDGSPSGSED